MGLGILYMRGGRGGWEGIVAVECVAKKTPLQEGYRRGRSWR